MASYGAGIFMVTTLLCCVVQCSEAKSIDVGGPAGWTSFESSQVTAPNYGAWAQSQKFSIGDTLVFKFAAGAHNVWLMKSHAAYQSCDFSGATLLDEGNSGFYTWTAQQPGPFFFSCDKGAEGVGTHCNYNQKLAIMVSKLPTSAPSPAPVKTPSPTPVKAPAPAPVKAPVLAPVIAPSPASVTFTPSPSPVTPPVPTPVNWAPAPAPVNWAPALAPAVLAPVNAPSPSPLQGGPAGFPSLAPSPMLSPGLSPFSVPVPAPSSGPDAASTPMALTPDTVSSSPLPGGGPTSDASPSPNGAGALGSHGAQISTLLCSVLFLCVLLW